MKLKTGENGEAVLDSGAPVFVGDDGSERTVDVGATLEALSKANAQAEKYRKQYREAEARLKLFGDLDPDTAKAAVAYREAIGEDVDPAKAAHEVADLRSRIAGLTSQVEERDGTIGKLNNMVDTLSYDAELRGSDFISRKVAGPLRPPERFRAAYGQHLERDEDTGRLVVKDTSGNTIMSEKNPGQPASLDEALPKIVAHTDLAAANAAGGGESRSNGAKPLTPGGKKLSDLTPAEAAKAVRAVIESGGSLKDLGLPA